MENKEQTDSSSFTADLFGADKSPPSTGILASIFPPPPTVLFVFAIIQLGFNLFCIRFTKFQCYNRFA